MPEKKVPLLKRREPKDDESFMGYLLRLSELNWFDTPSWMLQLAELKDYVQSTLPFVFNNSLNLSPLALLTCVAEQKLSNLIYHPLGSIRRKMGDYLIFGNPVPQYVIRPCKSKICPRCLGASSYLRRIWELSPVTACPIHRCLLLDECPSCMRSLPWVRKAVSICQCGFDWRDYPISTINDSEIRVTQHIHQLCNLPGGISTYIEDSQGNPLYALELKNFISALFFVASQYGAGDYEKGKRRIDTKGKYFAPSKTNADIHTLLCKALPVFDDWPTNYYSFLDEHRERKYSYEHTPTKYKYFVGYKSALFGQLGSPDFDFMRSAFREYRRIRRYESYIARKNDTTNSDSQEHDGAIRPNKIITISVPEQAVVEVAKLYETHMSGAKAKEFLKTAWRGLEQLISAGRLEAIIGNRGGKRIYFVDKRSLELLRVKLNRSIFLGQVMRLLGVYPQRLNELVAAGLLTPLRGPEVDGYGVWKFDHEEVMGLLNTLTGGLTNKRKVNGHKVLNFKAVLRIISRMGISLGALVQAILDGEIKPYGRTAGKGLQCLLFSKKQIIAYVRSEFRLLVGDTLSIGEAAKSLGITKEAASFLIKKTLLRAEKLESVPSLGLLVKHADLSAFNESYILAARIASEHHTSSEFIVDVLAIKGIYPVSGRNVDGGGAYVFRRSEIETVEIATLILDAKRERAIAWKSASSRVYTYILDEKQTADILGMDVTAVRQLAERGALRPYKRLSAERRQEEKYYFSQYAIEKYKRRNFDHTGLVAFTYAAKMLNLWPDNFNKKYIKTGRLIPALCKGRRCEHYFRVEDVEALMEVEKQTIITPEAAEILGVNLSCVDKMVAAGVLTPISGPKVDGFGKNLFLRQDVQRLHAQRQAFKDKRINEGRTSRFGKPTGPRARPVLDVIGPRIDQLREEWCKQSPTQYISGYRLYRQLISERFQVGIAAVYVYLRQKRLQAP